VNYIYLLPNPYSLKKLREALTDPEKHIALVCNPTRDNEKALRITNSIEILLSGMDIRHKVFTATWPEAFDGFTEAWIIGGDGTVNYFINQYSGIQVPLALFGGGSGNDFHWMLYGNQSIEKQAEYLLQAKPQRVDAGICNGKFFLNGVGVGFDGAIVHDLLGKKKLAGKASYLLSLLKQIVGYQEKPCVVQMPGETIRQDCFMISVANGKRYGGGFHVAPNAIITDGLLDVNIVGKISPIKRMKYLPVIEKGEHLSLDFITYKKTDKIIIHSSVKLHAHMDGEYFQTDYFDIELLPKRFSFIY
jgi:diacylglycerol kinase (ATP)